MKEDIEVIYEKKKTETREPSSHFEDIGTRVVVIVYSMSLCWSGKV